MKALMALLTMTIALAPSLNAQGAIGAAMRAGARSEAGAAGRTLGREIGRADRAMATMLEQQTARAMAEAAARRTATLEREALSARQAQTRAAEAQQAWRATTRSTAERAPAPKLTSTFDAVRDPSVVYLRINPKATTYSQRYYVGQSERFSTYWQRQKAHNTKLNTDHQYRVIATTRPGTPLRFAEESAIRAGGGKGVLANKRYEMNDGRYKAMSGTIPKPQR